MESFLDERIELHCGDMLAVLPTLAENSIDSCVCDPPYHLTSIVKRFAKTSEEKENFAQNNNHTGYRKLSAGFMGKQWDGGDIAFQIETWVQVLRVLKPGAHLIAFASTRTYHRMACAIEDAGFEIRDQIGWCYGSGFPKSHDVSKGIDRAAGAKRPVLGQYIAPDGKARGVDLGIQGGNFAGGYANYVAEKLVTGPATTAAREWEGWGTALKPAWEPIVLARKPLAEGTVAANVLKWGTGALNIDGCRIGTNGGMGLVKDQLEQLQSEAGWGTRKFVADDTIRGRFPANIIHDGSEEVLAAFPDSPGQLAAVNGREPSSKTNNVYGQFDSRPATEPRGDSGSAARFFYTAKADSDDRLGSKHPTVKPLGLMQYLVRLVTPPKGTVLDCFAGTGTTGEAAFREGFSAVLIEREAEYQNDIRRRMSLVLSGPDERARAAIKERMKDKPVDHGPLFEAAE